MMLVAVLLGSGCSSYDPPRLRVQEVTLADRSDEAVLLDFVLEATNRNEVELPLQTVDYAVSLDGRVVFEGRRSAEATLRRLGTQRIVLPAAVRLSPGAQATGLHRYRISGELTYVTPGEIAQALFDAGVRRPTIDFAQQGEIDFGP